MFRLPSRLPRSAALVAVAIVACAAVLPAPATAAPSPAASPSPKVTITEATGGKGSATIGGTNLDLAAIGYEQAEYIVSGTATASTSAQPLTTDGKWTVSPATSEPYATRVLVYRPIDPKKFNGTVVVEWLNVSAGLDSAPVWISAHPELVRKGFVWVGVSAQRVGIEGGGRAVVPNLDLKHADPARYGSLVHPGDSYSYDMFAQTGRAVRGQSAELLGGLKPKHVLAVGESQSANRMVTYANAFGKHPDDPYDGFLVYSRGGTAAPLSQAPQADVPVPDGTTIRTDLGKPVLTFLTETDLVTLRAYQAQQADSKWYREWQVPGTAHADTYSLLLGPGDTGDGKTDVALFDTMLDPPKSIVGGFITCDTPINAGPMTYVLRTAVDDLDTWVTRGTAPPKAPRLDVVSGTGTGTTPPQFRTDANGNVLGGIRTPHVDAPVAKLSGLGQTGASFCGIFGTTVPFDAATIASRYPTHAKFVRAWNRATDRAVADGFVLRADAPHLKAAGTNSAIGTGG